MQRALLIALIIAVVGTTPLWALSLKSDETSYDAGKRNFLVNCAVCHQADGSGSPQILSLVGSDWVNGEETRLVAFILRGSKATETYHHKPNTSECPAQGILFTDAKIAGLLTYIRASWGNHAKPVSEETVARISEALRK
jgi:mono/diheme cytochrome c family protein